MFSSSKTPASGGDGGNQRRGWMSGVLARVRDKALSPRVVQPSEGSGNKSWSCSTEVITDLTHFERVSLNAAEERVLPPEIRIKIVFAQANAGEQEEEMLETDVKRLDGLVRTIALYSILERNMMETAKGDTLTPDREVYLGKMLVAAVQLELFQMLDDICEAGDVENELFDDLCTDAIQDGRRAGFITMTAALLLSPGSGYKRLLQIRKDQILEEIADVAGLRALGGHDCQRDSSESPKTWSPRYRRRKAMDSDCGSPDPDSARVAAGLRISPNGADPATTAADLSDDLSPSPSSQRPDSLSPSPEMGHRRSETQRMRDVLSTIDGLMMEAEQPDEEEDALANLAVSPRGRSVRGYKRQSTGAHLDSFSGSGAGRASRLSLHTPPPRDDEEGGREGDDDSRAFFSSERGWRVSPFAATPPPELAKRRASVIPAAPGADEEDDPAAVDMLLAEVDWLIAGTNAALGVTETDDDDADGDNDDNDDGGGGSGDPIGNDGLEITPDKREELSPARRDVPESSAAARVAQEGERLGDVDVEAESAGKDILEITPDKRELSPRRTSSSDGDVPESANATRVAAEEGEEGEAEDIQLEKEGEVTTVCVGKEERVGTDVVGAGDTADVQQRAAGLPLPSPERALTASPSPETRANGSSSSDARGAVVAVANGGNVSDSCRDDGDVEVVGADATSAPVEGGEEEQGDEQPVVHKGVEPGLAEESSSVAAAAAAAAAAAVVAGTVEGEGIELRDAGEGATRGQEEEGSGTTAEEEEEEGQREEDDGNPTEATGGEGRAAEDETEESSVDTALDSAVLEDEPIVLVAAPAEAGEVDAPGAEVQVNVGETEREGEETGEPAVDAVVEPSVVSGVASEGMENGGVTPGGSGMNGSVDGKEEGVGGGGGGSDLEATRLVPESTEEEARQDQAARDIGSGNHAILLESPEESAGESDMDGPPAVADVTLEVVGSDASVGSDRSALVVETEAPGLADEELSLREDVAPVPFDGSGRRVPGNGLQKDPLGSRREEEDASGVVVSYGSEAPALQDVEL